MKSQTDNGTLGVSPMPLVRSIRQLGRSFAVALIALGSIGVVVAVSTSDAGAATTVKVSGGVSCSYNPVVGIWVQDSNGTGQFASWQKASPGGYSAAYIVSVPVSTTVQLRVGCGGNPTTWWSSNYTSTSRTIPSAGHLDAVCNEGKTASGPSPAPGVRCNWETFPSVIVGAAESMVGKPYCWNGGNVLGPTHGDGNGDNEATDCASLSTTGFDCVGLAMYALYHATMITLPRGNTGIWEATDVSGAPVTHILGPSPSQLVPGDILLMGPAGSSVNNYPHVAIYAGNNSVYDANTPSGSPPGPGPQDVALRPLSAEYSPILGAVRF
jgi:cell wall-associated NlpC family hydrolase